MTELALRPRSPTEILDLAVRLLRRHFGAFFVIALVGVVPGLVVQIGLLLTVGGERDLGLRTALAAATNVVFGALMLGALVGYGNEALLTGGGDAKAAIARAAVRLPVLLGVSVLSTLASLAGTLLLFFPGVYVGLRLTTAGPIAMLEGQGVFASIGRAWARGKGHVWHTFVALLLVGLLYFAFFLAVGMAAVIAALASGTSAAEGTLGPVLTQLGASLVTAVVYPVFSNTLLVLSYDLRVRREAYDVEVMAASLGVAS